MDTIGQRIKYLRTFRNVSQKDIEENTAISQSNLSKYELDKVKPASDAIIALSDFFNVSTDWLLKGIGPGPAGQNDAVQTSSSSSLLAKVQTAIDSDPAFAEWIDILLKLSPDARTILLNINRPSLSRTGAADPNKALSTSPNTGEDEQAAAKSDIA